MDEEANRTRPSPTRQQIDQRRLRPEGTSMLPDSERPEEASLTEGGLSPTRYAASQAKKADKLREKFGPDYIYVHPLINPVKIIETAAERPMHAAIVCFQACALLNNGHHERVREYLVAAYSVAIGFKAHRDQIKSLALELIDG